MNVLKRSRFARTALTLFASVAVYAAITPTMKTDAMESKQGESVLLQDFNSGLPAMLRSTFGTAGEFRFITPIALNPHDPSADFDAGLLPYLTVKICKVTVTDCTLQKTFTSTSSPDRLRIENKQGRFFIANWTTGSGFDNTPVYRISVEVPGETLGTVDLPPSAYRQWGRTWPIKFIVEKDAALRIRLLAAAGTSIWDVADNLRSELGICGDELRQLLLSTFPGASVAQVEQVVSSVCQDVILPPTTKIADAATRDALTLFDMATGRLIFANETTLLKNLKINDVLVSKPSGAAPYGYLRKVTSVRKDKTIYVVESVQASLTEAITRGNLDVSGELLPEDELPAEPLAANSAMRSSESATSETGSQSVTALTTGCVDSSGSTGYNFECSVNERFDFEKGVGEFNGTGHVNVSGNVFFSAGYDIGAGIEDCAPIPVPLCMDRFEARLRVKQKSEVHVDGQMDATVAKEIVIARKIFKPITFWLGPFPVVIVPVVNLVVGARGEAHITFDFDATAESGFAVGAKWTDENGGTWRNVSEKLSFGGSADANIAGNMTLIGYYKGNAKLLLYGAIGPSFGAVLGGRVDAQLPGDPLWSIYGHIAGDLAFEISIIDVISLGRFDLSYFVVAEPLIAEAPNQPPIFSNLRDGPIQARVNTSVYVGPDDGLAGKNYDVSDPEGDIPELTVSAPGGTVNGLRVTFPTPGLKTVKITARDSEGLTRDLYLGVDVRNSPPIVTITPDSGEIPAITQYWLTATAYDPEEGTLRCSRLTWSATGTHTKIVSTSSRTCTAVFKFNNPGLHTVTVSATDSLGATMFDQHSVLVSDPPDVPYPEIVPDSFSIQAISRIRRRDDDPTELGCIPGIFCEVENGDLIYNGYGGDFIPPLIMRLEASDPSGAPLIIDWRCQTGENLAPVTDNGDGSYSCTPIYSPLDPIKVYAFIYTPPPPFGEGNGPATKSEERTYFMLQAPN